MKNPKFDALNIDNYVDFNEKIINKWVDEEQYWGEVTSHEEFVKAQNGVWNVGLAFDVVPKMWFAPFIKNNRLDGVKLLGLASGGGQQIPILTAIGANCTVMDYSSSQLECEQRVAERENYNIELVKADMTKNFPFSDNCFDMIFHPVSNHFIEDIEHVWRECYRVLKPGGVLMAGMYNGVVYMFDDYDEDDENAQLVAKYKLPFNPLKDRTLYEQYVEPDDDENLTFSHSLEECIGGQLKAGLVLTDLTEAREPNCLMSQYFPMYFSTRAVKSK